MICRLGRGFVLCVGLLWSGTLAAAEPTVAELAKATQSGSVESRLAALDQLADLGPKAKAAVPEIGKALASDNPKVRWHAARALGAIGTAAGPAAPKLAELLADKDPAVRSHVAYALGHLGPASARHIQKLVDLIADKDPHVRRAAISALRRLHPDPEAVLPKIVEVLNTAEAPIALAAIHSIATYGEKSLPLAIQLLSDPKTTSKGRYWACVLLAEFGAEAKEAAKPLGAALKDEDPGVRMQAALTLAQIGPGAVAAEPDLIAALQDDHEAVQYAAAYALGLIGDKQAVPALEKAAESKDALVKTLAIWAIAKAQPDDQEAVGKAVDALVAAMDSDRIEVRQAAARALWDLKAPPEKVGPALAKALNDDDPEAVGHVLDSLASLGSKIAPRVSEALGDKKKRANALALVRRLGPEAKECVPALTKLLGETEGDEKREVLLALASVGPDAAAAVPEIVKSLSIKDGHREVSAAAFALGRIGPAANAALPALEAQLKNDSEYSRMAAAWALTQIDADHARAAKKVLPLLVAALTADLELVRIEAARGLGALGPEAKSAVPALKKATDDSSSAVSQAASEALEQINKK